MKTKMILVAVMALILGACGKQNSKNSGSTRFNRANSNQIANINTNCSSASWGRIYDNSTDDATFRQRVADFSLRGLEEIGTISPLYNSSTGIEFRMSLNFSNGVLVPQSSEALFKISDSYTIQENGGYIQFKMGGMVGQGMNGQFDVQIGDSKGHLRLTGQRTSYSGQQVLYGRAYYNNWNQGDQFLGEFVIGSCAATGI